ncbi:Laminin subunit gamma-1 [Schistosoma japonicum]|nr:Laminin subunit gamma-1 [Schistosoma japonicum]
MRLLLIKCYAILITIRFTSLQEPFDTRWVSSECSDANGKPQMCYPPFTSVAADKNVIATNTCGEKGRQKYCIHMSNSGMARRCQYCDARNPDESHPPEYMTDKNPNNWWQSETMADNKLLHFKESVNLTVDLGTKFHVNYIYLQFKSPRPHAMVIHKRYDDNSEWTPWAYFSSNCYTYFGMAYSPIPIITKPDELICYEEYSTLQPLYEGEVIFSVINGRPNYDKFFNDIELQRWSTASQILIELKKMHTFGDERGAERDTLLTYYFAIQKLTVGGRCLCHGHGNECRKSSGPGQKERLVCVCDPAHHAAGDNCEQCQSGYHDRPWQPATPQNPNPCIACNCNGNAHLCEFDAELYSRTGSGSRCIDCGNNTEGINCERCKSGYYPNPKQPTSCLPCSCDPIGTVDGQTECNSQGQCVCKPGIGGKSCDHCLDDHFGFSSGGCQPCNCNEGGSYENRPACDAHTGQCICKENVAGKRCDKCKLGHYGLMSNDPLGCKPCICSLHSSECRLDEEHISIIAGRPGESIELQSLVKPDQTIINCPANQKPCYACLQKDRQHIQIGCNGTIEGYLPCLCEDDPNQCPYCPSGWRTPQTDPRSEICTCPPQYTGKSCEFCADGHRRDPPGGTITDRCILCTCNNHATRCDPESGQCDCQDNTGGLFCDRCTDGYYGDPFAPVNSPEACKPCPCPPEAKCEQVHWPDRSIKVVCKDCPDNRSGIRCERCAENFYGDPMKGISCKPCDCSNNIDPREFGNCDGKTGECLKCLFGTTGKHCEQCLPGYRRNLKPINTTDSSDLIPARGCSPCQCNPIGTLANYGPQGIGVCNPETGQCPCKPGVGGLNCDKCFDGFYGFHTGQGCQPCDCNSVGSFQESCDDHTGQCECRSNVIGRQCDKCRSSFFNMTTSDGCQSCNCHIYGSENSQCDTNGQCICKPFAVGLNCDHCQENHYNLQAGCLPCPACYNLVQARVAKLWGMLESVFGPIKPESSTTSIATTAAPTTSLDDKELFEEIKRLNETIVKLYQDILHYEADNSIIDQNQFKKTLDYIANQIDTIDNELKQLANKPLTCIEDGYDKNMEQLQLSITQTLPRLLTDEAQNVLENLRHTISLYESDPILSKYANEASELVKELNERSEQLQKQVNNITKLLANSMNKLTESKGFIKVSKDTLQKNIKKSDEIEQNSLLLSNRIEALKDLMQKLRDQIYLTNANIDHLPDIMIQLRQLDNVAVTWNEAKQTSNQLKERLMNIENELHNQMNQLNEINNQLMNTLKMQQNQSKQIEMKFNEINNLLQRVLNAINQSWLTVDNARIMLRNLEGFDEHIFNTKSQITDVLKMEDELHRRLTDLASNVNDLHDQAKKEYLSAKFLYNQTIEIEKSFNEIEKRIANNKILLDKFYEKLTDLKTQHELEILPEIQQASQTVAGISDETMRIVETADISHRSATKLVEDINELLRRMKKFKEQLTETTKPGIISKPTITGEDAATSYAKLKDDLVKIRLNQRLNILKQLNTSRTTELFYLSRQINEYKLHYEHLQHIDSLLPTIEAGCFYTGKGIEGDEYERNRNA